MRVYFNRQRTLSLRLTRLFIAFHYSMKTVVATKSSASIHRPTMILSIANTTFWSLYAFAIQNYVILVPNGTGLALALVQALLCFAYPRRATSLHLPRSQDEGPGDFHDTDPTPEDVHPGPMRNY
jgi:uncharacterized protein with PQ loop repeat